MLAQRTGRLTLVDLRMDRTKRSVRFRKTDSLALIVDKVPRSNELSIGTEVVALYHHTIKRYYTGTSS